MKNFQIMPCTDNLIFGWIYNDDIFIRKRIGLLIEANDKKEEKENNGYNDYKTLQIAEDGEVCELSEDRYTDRYVSICHSGEIFKPKDFAEAMSYIVKHCSLEYNFGQIVKNGGIAKAPEEIDTIEIVIEKIHKGLILNTLNDFYSFGSDAFTNNPFEPEDHSVESLNIENFAYALQAYRKFYNRPNLKVKLLLKSNLPKKEKDKFILEWVPVLEQMINEGLSFEETIK